MSTFIPCQGKDKCRDDGSKCLTCGRQFDEIVWLRDLVDQLASLANEYNYENIEDYAGYVSRKVIKTIQHRRQLSETGNG